MSAAANPTHELTGNQYRAIRALLSGESSGAVARMCGVSERTLRDWQSRPEFHAALEEGRNQIVQAVCIQIANAAADAVRVLITIYRDPGERSTVRAAAAGKLLNFLFRSGSLVPPPSGSYQDDSPDSFHHERLLSILASAPAPEAEQLLSSLMARPTALPDSAAAFQQPQPQPGAAVPDARTSARTETTISQPDLHSLAERLASLSCPASLSGLPARPARPIPVDDRPARTPERALSLKVPVAAP